VSADFITWLESVTCTKPFTCTDARELFDLIHKSLPDTVVDVYSHKGDVVCVRIETARGVIECELPVV
jgi:hypothetical protein